MDAKTRAEKISEMWCLPIAASNFIESQIEEAEREAYEKGCIELSEKLEEHPEDWNGPCFCQTCKSYAD